MATKTSIKVKFRPSSIEGNKGTVYYQIIKDRKVRQLSTNYRIYKNEWDEKHASLIIDCGIDRSTMLCSIKDGIRRDLECLGRIVKKHEQEDDSFTCDDIISEFHDHAPKCTLFNYMENLIDRLRQNGKIRTAETYRSSLNSFKRFRQGADIMLNVINSRIMQDYEAFLAGRKVTPNTISFYMRILRAVYNKAVEDNLTDQRRPFRHVYTGIEKTVKRALPLRDLKKIKNIDLSMNPKLDYARDMFMLSFFFRGMSFIDMSFLKKSDLKNGHIIYRRSKTGQQLTIKWTDEMQQILDKYPKSGTRYLLPIIKSSGKNERNIYKNVGYKINGRLKKIAKLINLKEPLTMYVARHTWASVAKSKGIPIGIISEGMGHESENTTRIYLASLNTSIVDRANSIILKSL